MMRPTDLFPRQLCDELIILEHDHPDWFRWRWLTTEDGDRGGYEVLPDPRPIYGPVTTMARVTSTDLLAFRALGRWLAQGPKTFYPDAGQCRALENVRVSLSLEDYRQPYPAVMVALPKDMYGPFRAALTYLDTDSGPSPLLAANLISKNNADDIVTTIGGCYSGQPIEASINRFDHDCLDLVEHSVRALRVAINGCLALTHFGHRASPSFPHDVERDKRLAREDSDRGRRARERLSPGNIITTVAFDQHVQLHDECLGTPGGCDGVGAGTGTAGGGGEKSCHWRRGHWAMQPCGPKRQERRRVFRKPVLVRADQFHGDMSATRVSYSG